MKVEQPKLFKCEPVAWLWMPKIFRSILAWITVVFFSTTFLVIPIMVVALPILWFYARYWFMLMIALLAISMLTPLKEWPVIRSWGQLWYEHFDFSCNLSPEQRENFIKLGHTNKYAIGMHPHGIIPLQAVLWAAYCDQYMSSASGSMYGFGAAADVVAYLPILRNIMGWLTGGSAEYKVLKDGLEKGICPLTNRVGRIPRHLYILPGGVAEIFVSTPGKHAIVFKHRRGLIKLALETGTHLIPNYVFGGTDFFNNLATGDGFFSTMSRKLRMGLTIFWGYFGLPIPFQPRVTMVIADPIEVPKWTGEGKIPSELMDKVHKQVIVELFLIFYLTICVTICLLLVYRFNH